MFHNLHWATARAIRPDRKLKGLRAYLAKRSYLEILLTGSCKEKLSRDLAPRPYPPKRYLALVAKRPYPHVLRRDPAKRSRADPLKGSVDKFCQQILPRDPARRSCAHILPRDPSRDKPCFRTLNTFLSPYKWGAVPALR